MGHLRPLALLLLALGSVGCVTASYQRSYDPRPRPAPPADVQAELSALADSLQERASLRTSLGTARVVIEDLEVVQPREARYRYAVLQEHEVRATQETVRQGLEMSLGNRLNVVDTAALAGRFTDGEALRRAAGATHAVTGTLVREGDDVDIALKLVDLRDGWIVATAQRRIERFVARDLVPAGRVGGAAADPRRHTAEVKDLAAAAPELLAVVEAPSAAAEPGATAAPDQAAPDQAVPDEVPLDPDGVPLGAEIEFEQGPAASRLGGRPER